MLHQRRNRWDKSCECAMVNFLPSVFFSFAFLSDPPHRLPGMENKSGFQAGCTVTNSKTGHAHLHSHSSFSYECIVHLLAVSFSRSAGMSLPQQLLLNFKHCSCISKHVSRTVDVACLFSFSFGNQKCIIEQQFGGHLNCSVHVSRKSQKSLPLPSTIFLLISATTECFTVLPASLQLQSNTSGSYFGARYNAGSKVCG